VFAFPNVFDFFAHKLARLSGRRLAFALIFARAFNWFFFWHNKMISPLTTRLDVINNAGLWKAGNSRQLSSVPVAFRADLRVSDAKKFGVTQMPTGKRSRVGMFSLYFSDDEKRICAGRAAIKSLISGAQTPLPSLLCLISDQSFCGGWSLAGCRLEFLAARIVVRNKEVLNFAY
jgi:hypothetical protein